MFQPTEMINKDPKLLTETELGKQTIGEPPIQLKRRTNISQWTQKSNAFFSKKIIFHFKSTNFSYNCTMCQFLK